MASEFKTDVKHDFDLEAVLNAFKSCHSPDNNLVLDQYVAGYQELCRFFKLTGKLFGFVASELESKIHILETHRKSENGNAYETIQSMIDFEVTNGITKVSRNPPSGSRTLLRLHRALGFISEFMDRIAKSDDDAKTSDIASEVYKKTLGLYHPWIIQKMAGLAMYMLPSRRQLIDTMCKQNYEKAISTLPLVVDALKPVYNITQELYETNDLLNLP
ncbi:ceramide-1-phosphate transfer protein-like [Mizuhopecten yessoensis]|uniref:Glycolipid transfer protein domain-containing protein 1 n=1 Tax=Mizuhopecten yessoensis TaxID=6573 RepID=A0A210Q5N3_MIZYE|nr:ceramide-1-phosphate transfer protein-like [Mizuhopecten yessoensis]OWF44062.1 Glycolipid transfer protein domain-containing protein 1 [Mizuhopecten yessoensis]